MVFYLYLCQKVGVLLRYNNRGADVQLWNFELSQIDSPKLA